MASQAVEKLDCERVLGRHELSRADKSSNLVIPKRLQPPRNLLFRIFPHPVQPCR